MKEAATREDALKMVAPEETAFYGSGLRESSEKDAKNKGAKIDEETKTEVEANTEDIAIEEAQVDRAEGKEATSRKEASGKEDSRSNREPAGKEEISPKPAVLAALETLKETEETKKSEEPDTPEETDTSEEPGASEETDMPEEPLMVWADEFMIEEVVSNYISNAINHAEPTKDNDTGEDRCLIEIKAVTNDGKARISVFNTGKPIPDEDVDKIWNKFYKVDKARTRQYGGNGIGLSIVKAVLDAHNQRFGVNNYDNGVEFWFELDVTKQ